MGMCCSSRTSCAAQHHFEPPCVQESAGCPVQALLGRVLGLFRSSQYRYWTKTLGVKQRNHHCRLRSRCIREAKQIASRVRDLAGQVGPSQQPPYSHMRVVPEIGDRKQA